MLSYNLVTISLPHSARQETHFFLHNECKEEYTPLSVSPYIIQSPVCSSLPVSIPLTVSAIRFVIQRPVSVVLCLCKSHEDLQLGIGITIQTIQN